MMTLAEPGQSQELTASSRSFLWIQEHKPVGKAPLPFQAQQQRAGSKVMQVGLELVLIWEASSAGRIITHYTTVPAQ